MKKIIYIGNFDLTKDNAALNRVISNLYLIDDRDYDKYILGFGQPTASSIKNESITFISKKRPTNLKQWFAHLINPIKEIGNISKNDIIICYNLPSLAMSRILKKYSSSNIILSDVTEWYDQHSFGIISAVKQIDVFLRMHILNNLTDGIIVVSEYLKTYYKKHNNVIILPPLMKISEKEFISNQETQLEKKKELSVKYLYAGSPGYTKDRLDLILEAFYQIYSLDPSALDSISFDVFGPTKEELLAIFPELKGKLDVLAFIKFHGYKEKSIINEYLSKADYTFLLREKSRRNDAGFPTKFSEAKSLGINIIYNDFSDVAQYVGKEDIFVNVLEPRNIKKAIHKSVENKLTGNISSSVDLRLTTLDTSHKQNLEKLIQITKKVD